MPIDPFAEAPRQSSKFPLSRRGMLQAGLLPLLEMPGSAIERFLDNGSDPAVALPLEGAETGTHGTAISPDGSTAYVAFMTPDVVLAVDLLAGRVKSRIDLTPAGSMLRSRQAVLSADGRLLFVVNQGVGNIAVIDTAAERVIKVLPFCPGYGDAVTASPAGKVYIGLLDGRLITVSCADLSFTARNLGLGFDSIALSTRQANLLYAVSLLGDQCLFHAFTLDTWREERRAILPAGACRPSGGITRILVAAPGDVAYLGWSDTKNLGGFGNITPFELGTFQAGPSTAIEDGVNDFAVHPESGRVYAVGTWEGPIAGRTFNTMYISEWDPASQKVTRRLPISPSSVVNSILFDPLNPRFVYVTECTKGLIRKVDTLSGTEYMRVRFFPGKRMLYAATADGALGYVTGYASPVIHKLDLNSGKLAGTLELPGLSGSGDCAYHDGKLYVGDYSHFSVISAADGSLLFSREVPEGLFLAKLRFFRDKIATPAGPKGGDADRILILDARTLDILSTFRFELPWAGRIGFVVASPDGAKLYVQQEFSLERTILEVLDSTTLQVLKRIEPPTTALQGGAGDVGCFDEQRRIAYLAGFNSVYKVHMDTNEFLGMLNIYDVYTEMGRPMGWPASALTGIHLSPDRDRLLIVSWDGHCVFQYDLTNEKWIPQVVWVGLGPAATMVSPDRKYLYTANYRSDTVTRLDTTTGQVVDRVSLGGPVSQLSGGSLTHAASYQDVGVVPGCVMVIRDGGGGLPGEIGPPFLTLLQVDGTGKVAMELGDTRVLFDGVPAPLIYAYAAHVALVVPYSVAGKRKVKMQLIYKGEETYPVEFNVGDAGPGIFSLDSTGAGQAAMLNQDYSVNGPANPAEKGSVVMIYATGGGQTDIPGVDGEVTGSVLSRPLLPVRVWIGDREAEVQYAGSAPGIVSGVLQVNVRVPHSVSSGNSVPVTMMVGPFGPSPDVVTIAVK